MFSYFEGMVIHLKSKFKLLGFYNYTVILTYIGMLSGFLGVIFAFESNQYISAICLMVAGFCDMFDGAVASTMERNRREKTFGIQIDSLSDLICFGVLPSILVYSLHRGSKFAMAVCGFYVLCALIRLAYFNVDEQERQEECDGAREIYYGLPVTMSALIIPIFYSAARILCKESSAALVAALLVMAMLFVLPFKLKKPKLIGKLFMLTCGICEFVLLFIS